MHIEALRFFCDAVSCHSFSDCAEKNGVTQSTVSQAIHKLEEHFGAALIDRSTRPWKVTDKGRMCYEQARNVLQSFCLLEQVMHPEKAEKFELRVASIYSVGFSYMRDYVEIYSAENKADELVVDYLHPNKIIEKVLGEEMDLGIIAFPPNRRDLTVIPWIKEEMVVACSTQHELASFGSIEVDDLDGLSRVGFDNELKIGRKIGKYLRDGGAKCPVVLHFDNIESIKRAVEDSDHFAVLPKASLKREIENGSLVAVAFEEPKLFRPLGIIHRKCREVNTAMQRFIEFVLKASA